MKTPNPKAIVLYLFVILVFITGGVPYSCKVPTGTTQPNQKVAFLLAERTLFVGAYIKVPIRIAPGSGLKMGNLDFLIPAGEKAGLISLSKEKNDDPNHPYIMLLAGYEPGNYELQAIEKSTGNVAGRDSFSISTFWNDSLKGPSLWVTGDFEVPGTPGAVWGGGSSTQPDHFETIPAKGIRNVAVLLVDTKSQRFTAEEVSSMLADWKKIVFDGHMVNGKKVSTAHYYREVSHNQLNFTGQVFGPVNLPGNWNDYLQDNGNYKPNIWQACATAGDKLIDYSKFNHLVCVIKSVDASGTIKKKAVWAHADGGVFKVAEGSIPLGTADMPAEGKAFDLSAILAHELGHNLKLGDIYNWGGHPKHIQDRQPGDWALMAYQRHLPQMLLAHRMMLGWAPKKDLKLYNFQNTGGYVDETITLYPVEKNNPPFGNYSGVEVRIAPGRDYYFEYRVGQSNQIGDQDLPAPDKNIGAVVGTDVSFAKNFNLLSRRKPILLLPKDADGDGPILGLNQDFKTQDLSEQIPADFKVKVTKIDGKQADLHIQYGISSQPDPAIRSWSPPVYQSPDIEVFNKRNEVDNKWKNVPWAGHQNTVVARVTNKGKLNAPGVRVDFYVKDYTVNGSGIQPTFIGSDTKSVNALKTEEFKTTWMPLKAGHFCIMARIQHYQTPGPNSVIESTELNNTAQSNYDRFISATASPPSREVTRVKVHNPYDKAARVYIRLAKSTSPLYRTYIEHTWVLLQPKETREVKLMFEYAFEEDPVRIPELEEYLGKPNDISIYGLIEKPDSQPELTKVPMGGISVQVVTGKATRFEEFALDPPNDTFGRITTADGERPVPGGQVILILQNGDSETYRSGEVREDGTFNIEADGRWDSVQAYYVPLGGYADSESEVIRRP